MLVYFDHCIDRLELFAGEVGETGFSNGKGKEARFFHPYGICLNPNDNCLYVCDHGNKRIRKVTMEGTSFVSLSA